LSGTNTVAVPPLARTGTFLVSELIAVPATSVSWMQRAAIVVMSFALTLPAFLITTLAMALLLVPLTTLGGSASVVTVSENARKGAATVRAAPGADVMTSDEGSVA